MSDQGGDDREEEGATIHHEEEEEGASGGGMADLSTVNLDDEVDTRDFVLSPAPKDMCVQCKVERTPGGVGGQAVYRLFLETTRGNRFMLVGRKYAKSRTSNYHIWVEDNPAFWTNKNYFAKARSNGEKTEYTVFDSGLNPKKGKVSKSNMRKDLCVALYSPTDKKTPRKIKVIVPGEGDRETIKNSSLSDCHHKGRLSGLLVLENKQPHWSNASRSYVLKFEGKRRVTIASAKNFMLVQSKNPAHVYFQFGKIGEDLFTCDFRWPISPLQAFGIVLTSFDK
mmetsp:Transcript_7611/g.19729  ORF Transcript_7611/g.19729 Transcript_7611/m.19729 type:complete len:282 (-) Transcript_7611:1601-2446(-)